MADSVGCKLESHEGSSPQEARHPQAQRQDGGPTAAHRNLGYRRKAAPNRRHRDRSNADESRSSNALVAALALISRSFGAYHIPLRLSSRIRVDSSA